MKRQLYFIENKNTDNNKSTNPFVRLLQSYPEILSVIFNNLSPEDIVNLLLSRILFLQRKLNSEYDEKDPNNRLYNAFEFFLNNNYKDVLLPFSNRMIHTLLLQELVENTIPSRFDVTLFKSQIEKENRFPLIKTMFNYGLCLCEFCKKITDSLIFEKIINYNITDQLPCIFVCHSCDLNNRPLWVSSKELRTMAKTKKSAEDYAFSIIRSQNNNPTRYFRKDILKKLENDEIERVNNEILKTMNPILKTDWYADAVNFNNEPSIRKKVVKIKKTKMFDSIYGNK